MASNIQFSTGFRDDMLSGTAIDTAFDSGFLDIYDGTQPTESDDLVGAGTKLARIDLPANAFNAVSAGAITLLGTWEEVSAIATSTATWFRLLTSTDLGTDNVTDVRVDGTVTTVADGTGDLLLTSTSIASTDKITIDSFTITIPAQ